jgi:Phytanoyl-CoA dioxygenase (PhyH)
LTADLKYALRKEAVAGLVGEYGITAAKGPAGSVLFFHSNMVHGSPNNISPFDRLLAISPSTASRTCRGARRTRARSSS